MENLLETKELNSRKSDCLTVTLWWVKGTLETFVTVLDTRPEPPVEHHIDVPEGISAQLVFDHPFSYLNQPEAA